MTPVLAAAVEIQEFCLARGWQFCIIGGVAVLRWGQPRTTQDVDISLLTNFGDEAQYIDPLIEAFSARISDARQFAIDHRVLLIFASNGVPLDVSLAGLPFELRVIERASFYDAAPGCKLLTASAEDLVVLKAFADRSKDWGDLEGVLSARGESFERPQVIKDI